MLGMQNKFSSNSDFSKDFASWKSRDWWNGKSVIHCGCGNADILFEIMLCGAKKGIGIEKNPFSASSARQAYWELVNDINFDPFKLEIFLDDPCRFPYSMMFEDGEFFDIGIIFPSAHIASEKEVIALFHAMKFYCSSLIYYFTTPLNDGIGLCGLEHEILKFRMKYWDHTMGSEWKIQTPKSKAILGWRILYAEKK